MGKFKPTTVFVCPCEENELHIENEDFEPTYCPWCGDLIEDLVVQEEELYDSDREWDDQDNNRF